MDDLGGMYQDASLRRQLAETEKNLRLLKERKTEYVYGTDVPLQLIKAECRLSERIAHLKAELRKSAEGAVDENEAFLVISYLREAALDIKQLPRDNLGAILECVVKQIIERDCCRLARDHNQIPSAGELCRQLSYLGWYMFNEGITSCNTAHAATVIGEILTETQDNRRDADQILDCMVATYWVRKTWHGGFKFRDHYIINVFAAMELKERFSTAGVLGLGPGGYPSKWKKVIVLLAGMLTQDQAIGLIEVLLDAGLVLLAGLCAAEVQSTVVARVIHALLAQLNREHQQ